MGINDEREIKLTTDRLILREFNENDFAAVHTYASDIENIKYMIWGPNSEDDTVEFLVECIENANKNPRKQYDFAVTLKDTGNVIGGCGIYLNDTLDEALKRFKRDVSRSGTLVEARKRQHYMKPSDVRKEKRRAARKNGSRH